MPFNPETTIRAVPAYGRFYDDKEALLRDWHDGKDFKMMYGGPYFSSRDARVMLSKGVKVIKFALVPVLVQAQFDAGLSVDVELSAAIVSVI